MMLSVVVSVNKECAPRWRKFLQDLHYLKFLIPEGMRVLELGCSTGFPSAMPTAPMAKRKFLVFAMDCCCSAWCGLRFGALRKRDVESADGLGLLSTTHPFAAYGPESEI
jgi:hypothetical protein